MRSGECLKFTFDKMMRCCDILLLNWLISYIILFSYWWIIIAIHVLCSSFWETCRHLSTPSWSWSRPSVRTSNWLSFTWPFLSLVIQSYYVVLLSKMAVQVLGRSEKTKAQIKIQILAAAINNKITKDKTAISVNHQVTYNVLRAKGMNK